MVTLMRILNVSWDDLDNLDSIEALLERLDRSKFKFDSWIKEIGELYQQYGIDKRIHKLSDNGLLYKDLVKAYLFKLIEYDIIGYKVLDENYLEGESTIEPKFNEIVKKVEAFSMKEFNGSERTYMEHYFNSISVGRRVSFILRVTPLTEKEEATLMLYGHIQILRAVFKLEDFFSEKQDAERFIRLKYLLTKAYSMIDIDVANIAVDSALLNDIGRTFGDEIDEGKLNDLIMESMTKTKNLKIEPNIIAAFEQLEVQPAAYEREILSARFMKLVLQEWKEESFEILRVKMENMNIDALYELLKSFDNANTLQKVPEVLHNQNYKILMENLEFVDQDDASDALEDIYNFVYENVDIRSDNLGKETQFWQLLLEILRAAYKDFKSIVTTLKLNGLKNEPADFQKLLRNVKDAKLGVENFAELQEVATLILNANAQLLSKENMKVIIDYAKEEEMRENTAGRIKVLEIFGKNVRVEDFTKEIRDKAKNFGEFRFIGMDVLHVDASFEQNIFNGKNFFIMANEVRVHGEVKWNASGNDNDDKVLEKADTGADGRGKDGLDGVAGDFGGSVVVACSKIDKAENWSIKANGGMAATGQEGGGGEDGLDGEKYNFKKVEILNPNIGIVLDHIVGDFKKIEHREDGGDYNRSIKKVFRNPRGSIFTEYNYYNGLKREKLTMVQGADGGLGLSGGRYGLGGEGGFAGDILMLTTNGNEINFDIDVESFRGAFGDDGKGGENGHQGKGGTDGGFWSNMDWWAYYPKESGVNNELRFKFVTSSYVSASVWFGPLRKYATITVFSSPNRNPIRQEKTRNSEKVTRSREEQALAKKGSPVLWKDMLDQYQDLLNNQIKGSIRDPMQEKEFERIKQKTQININMKVQQTVETEIKLDSRGDKEMIINKTFFPKPQVDIDKLRSNILNFGYRDDILLMLKNIEFANSEDCEIIYKALESLVEEEDGERKAKPQPSFLESVKRFVSTYVGSDSTIKKYHEEFRQFSVKQSSYREAFFKILTNSSSELQELYTKSQTQDWARIEFEKKIKTQKELNDSYEEYKSQDFDWSQCLNDDEVFQEFFNYLLDNVSSSVLNHFEAFYSDLTDQDLGIMISKLMLEKYKFVKMNELKLKSAEAKELDEVEFLDFLKVVPAHIESDKTHSRLGRLQDFFSSDDKISEVQKNTMATHLRNIADSPDTNYEFLFDPFRKFLDEKIATGDPEESDKGIFKILKAIQAELAHIAELLTDDVMNAGTDDEDSGEASEPKSKKQKLAQSPSHAVEPKVKRRKLKEAEGPDEEDRPEVPDDDRFTEGSRVVLQLQLLIESLSTEEVLEAFVTFIQDKGTSSAAFRSLLAKAYDITFLVYNEVDFAINLKEVCNGWSQVIEIFRIFIDSDGDLFPCELVNTQIDLQQQRIADEFIYQRVTSDFQKLTSKEQVDDYEWSENAENSSDDEISQNTFNLEIDEVIENLGKLFFDPTDEDVSKHEDLIASLKELAAMNPDRKLLDSLFLKFHNDGVYMPAEEFTSIIKVISRFICDNKQFINFFMFIFATRKQRRWLPELIVLQVENQFGQVEELWRRENVDKMSALDNRRILLLLSAKLHETYQLQLKLEIVSEIINAAETFKMESLEFLKELALASWRFAISANYWPLRVKIIFDNPIIFEEIGALASYHLSNLQFKYETKLVMELMDVFETKIGELKKDDFMLILAAFNNDEVILNEAVLRNLGKLSIEDWIEINRLKEADKQKQRTIDEVVEIIINSLPDGSEETIVELKAIRDIINGIPQRTSMGKKISDFTEADIKKWRNEVFTISTDPAETVAVIGRAFSHAQPGSVLRNTNMFSILRFWRSKKDILAQIGTGEGKTWIGVSLGIMKVLYGGHADIITSSNLLAIRDAEAKDSNAVFELFNVSVGHNCSEDVEDRKSVYKKANVIYGSLSSFQRDFLLDTFFNKNITGGRERINVIVDEVDSMLLDKGNNILYLSHDLPDMQEIESVYYFIWQWVNQAVREEAQLKEILNQNNFRNVVLNEIWGLLTKTQMAMFFGANDAHLSNRTWNSLLEAEWIDYEGKILVDVSNITKENLKKILPENLKSDIIERIYFFLNEQKTRPKMIKFPKYLESFVLLHLDQWIKSSIRAMIMESGRQYIVDYPTSEGQIVIRRPEPAPIIIDLDTGADQANSQWDEALHQFLQLKHGCKLNLQSLKSVFISNVSYFKLYEHIYGMSGTLGSTQERERVVKIHDLDFVTMPTFIPKRFMESEPRLCESYAKWLESIKQICVDVAKTRAVLVICETIKDVDDVFKNLSNGTLLDLISFKREADVERANIGRLEKGQVIVATNVAGRGMDLKLSDAVKKAGGLHVLITTLPSNIRVEMQAFGRSARAGDAGTGQLCVNTFGSFTTIFELKEMRNNLEIQRLEKVFQYYVNFITIEESFFTMFNQQYQNIGESNDRLKIFKKNFLDHWSFWLDEHSKEIEESTNKKSDALIESLKEFMATFDARNIDWSSSIIHKSSKLNYIFQVSESDAENLRLLRDIIKTHPEDSINERYYEFYFDLKGRLSGDCLVQKLTNEQIAKIKEIISMAEKRKEHRLLGTELIRPLVEQNKRNFIQVNGLSDQQEIYDDIDDVMIYSLNSIIGHPVFAEIFRDIETFRVNYQNVFDALVKENILYSESFIKEIPIDKCKAIAKKNFIYSTKFIDVMQSFRGKNINTSTFGNEVKNRVRAPDRENFWKVLTEQSVLSKEVEYAIFNTVNLKDHFESILNELESMSSLLVEIKAESSDEIFLHQIDENYDSKEAYLIFLRSSVKKFESQFDKLIKQGCLALNKKAKFDTKKSELFQFKEFNLLEQTIFGDFNIPLFSALGIVDMLVDQKVLTKSNQGFTLIATADDFDFIDLEENSVYERRVIDILYVCFPYQIALQKIVDNIELNSEDEKSTNITTVALPSNSHLNIMSDLIINDFIEPSRVNPNWRDQNFPNLKERDQIEKLLVELSSTLLSPDTNCPELKLKRLEEFVEHLKDSMELQAYKNSGFVMVFEIEDKPYTWETFWRMIIIVIMGLVQMILGAALAIFSSGALAAIGNSLMGEGLGDILFAVSSYISGYFSWLDYAKHKVTSLVATVMTGGLGWYMSRGKEAVALGFKLYGNIREVIGALRKAAWLIFKKVSYKILKAASLYIVSKVFDKLAGEILRSIILEMAKKCTPNVDQKLNEADLNEDLEFLYTRMTHKDLMNFINISTERSIKKAINAKEAESKIFGTIGKVMKILEKTDDKKNPVIWLSYAQKVLSTLDIAVILVILVARTQFILGDLKTEIARKAKEKEDDERVNNTTPWNQVKTEINIAIRQPIEEDMSKIVAKLIVSPMLKSVATSIDKLARQTGMKIVKYTIEGVKHSYNDSEYILRNYSGFDRLNDLELTLQEMHERKVLRFMSKTNNSGMIGTMIRDKHEINQPGIKASANTLPDVLRSKNLKKEKILIEVTQEDGETYSFGEEGGIILAINLKKNASRRGADDIRGFDSLYYAMLDDYPPIKVMSLEEFRMSLANIIETDPYTKKLFSSEYQEGALSRSGHGGNIVTNDFDANEFLRKVFRERKYKLKIIAGLFSNLKNEFAANRQNTRSRGKEPELRVFHTPPADLYSNTANTLGLPALIMVKEDNLSLESVVNPEFRQELKKLISEGKWCEVLRREIGDIIKTSDKNNENRAQQVSYRQGLSQLLVACRLKDFISSDEQVFLQNQFELPQPFL